METEIEVAETQPEPVVLKPIKLRDEPTVRCCGLIWYVSRGHCGVPDCGKPFDSVEKAALAGKAGTVLAIPAPLPTEIGRVLYHIRMLDGSFPTQEAIARKTGMPVNYIARVEACKRESHLPALEEFAKAFSVPVWFILKAWEMRIPKDRFDQAMEQARRQVASHELSYEHVGEIIREMRHKLAMGSDGFGVSASILFSIEEGKTAPSMATLVCIARKLKTHAWVLIRILEESHGIVTELVLRESDQLLPENLEEQEEVRM